MEKSDRIRIELTPDQRQQLKDASGQEVTALELNASELEERVAPYLTVTLQTATITGVSLP